MESGGTAPQFLISGLDESEWSASRPGRFTPGKKPGIRVIGNWMGPRDGLEAVEKRKMLGIKPGR
jgi:hypothetical protein